MADNDDSAKWDASVCGDGVLDRKGEFVDRRRLHRADHIALPWAHICEFRVCPCVGDSFVLARRIPGNDYEVPRSEGLLGQLSPLGGRQRQCRRSGCTRLGLGNRLTRNGGTRLALGNRHQPRLFSIRDAPPLTKSPAQASSPHSRNVDLANHGGRRWRRLGERFSTPGICELLPPDPAGVVLDDDDDEDEDPTMTTREAG